MFSVVYHVVVWIVDDGESVAQDCFGITCVFFFQAEDGIRDLVRSRGLGDVYKRQVEARCCIDRGEPVVVPYTLLAPVAEG